jgi:ATP-dependent 26S proteasome regulatory subunit
VQPFASGPEHLLAVMECLDLFLQREVARLRAARLFHDDPFRGLHITDDHVDRLLEPSGTGDGQSGDLTRRIDETATRNLERSTPDLPLPTVVRRFDLDEFETCVLLLAVASEVDDRYATLFAYVQNDVTRKRPTVALALRLFHETPARRLDARAAFRPSASLFAHQLIQFAEDASDRDPPLPSRPLRASERLVDFLLGQTDLDPQLSRLCRYDASPPGIEPLPHPDEMKRRLQTLVKSLTAGGSAVFHGPTGSGRRRAASAVFAECGKPTLCVEVRSLIDPDAITAGIASLIRREAMLLGAGIYVDGCEVATGDNALPHRPLSLLRELNAATAPVIFGTTEPPAGLAVAAPVVHFAPFAFGPRHKLWQAALNGRAETVPYADLADVSNTYRLGPDQIASAASAAILAASLRPGDLLAVTAADLRDAATSQAGPTLRRLGKKVTTPHTWDDLIVPAVTLQRLREITTAVRLRPVVYAEWGFDRRLPYGKGTTALFSGPSGTGKTMAAAILARELCRDMFAIDLSAVVSKYIGETEKNLCKVFDEAEAAHAMLFFDEADALFGKRSAVKDAHDRYANIEVAFLLQKLEAFEGVVVLASNLPKNVDGAFARRIGHAIEFPFPDAPLRERLWRSVFPPGVPLALDVDLSLLARQFELSGGNIRNVALAAAFHAAEANDSLGMSDLIPAVAHEIQKSGKLPAKADFGEYYHLLHEGEPSEGGQR